MNDLRSLRHAITLARYGNFARAAKALHLTQPSLTRRIALLERELGVTLFDRTRKGVYPTAYGRVLVERGEALLRSEAILRRAIDLLSGLQQGSLSIGAGPYASEISVATAIARMTTAYPGLRIQCKTADPEQVLQDVLAERLDVGVAWPPGKDYASRLVIEKVQPLRVYLACRPGHPLTREPTITLAEALKYPLVTSLLRDVHAAAAASRGTATTDDDGRIPDYMAQILVNSPLVGRLVARDSDALFPGTARQLADDIAYGRLVVLEFDAPVMRTSYAVYYLRDRSLSPAATMFIKTLNSIEAEIAAADRLPLQATPRRRRGQRI